MLDDGAVLNICDCKGGGSIVYNYDSSTWRKSTILVKGESTLNLYGGSVIKENGTETTAVDLNYYAGANFHMYGGKVENRSTRNSYNTYAVYVGGKPGDQVKRSDVKLYEGEVGSRGYGIRVFIAENTKQFFQITEAARACGLSRSTLMRMEERGLLTPVFTAPDSGRRYYDNHNVARIMQIEKFKAMGLGSKEIADYFAQGGEAEVLLEALETRLRDLQRSVEEMRLRAAEGESLSVQMMELPAVTCRIRWCEGLTTAERYRDMYDFYGACVRKGCVLSDEPLFTISERTDYLEGYIGQEPCRYGVCVPVRKNRAAADAVTLEACRVLSVLYYGDYSGVGEAWLTLGREVKARGLKPAGAPRVLGIVAPYTGREIETRRYCSRLALPVEE